VAAQLKVDTEIPSLVLVLRKMHSLFVDIYSWVSAKLCESQQQKKTAFAWVREKTNSQSRVRNI
jgi:hypothetical protein